MSLTRRQFLRRSALVVPAAALGPHLFLRAALGAPGGLTKNLILVELGGGNDGINMMVPFGVDGGTYYTEFRPTIGVPEGTLLKVSGQQVGFHPALAALKAHYDAGRLAVVQGVGYPNPNYSHEVSQRIWHTGNPSAPFSDGWLARWLNLYPAPSFPCAIEQFDGLTPLTLGTTGFVPAVPWLGDFEFPTDGWHWEDAANRKNAFVAIANAQKAGTGKAATMAGTSASLIDLMDTFDTLPQITYTGSYPDHWFKSPLKLCARLLAANLGLRVFHLGFGGFDTHEGQDTDGYHAGLLSVLSEGLAALHTDLVAQNLHDDTLIVVFTEFGRTVYENGSQGTDHGHVAPVLVLGSGVNGGFVGAHPSMDPANLTDDDGELPMVTDFRDVFGTVMKRWMGEGPANLATLFPGHAVTDLGFLP